ncbi:14128_t:CDS:2, partial [Acaulospora colombiana]
VGGDSYSVGAAGGWILGGGLLEFEVVTPDCELRGVNTYENKDLFWSLRGGGPGFGLTSDPLHRPFQHEHKIYPIILPRPLKAYLLLKPMFSARSFSGHVLPPHRTPSTNSTIFATNLLASNSAGINRVNLNLQPIMVLSTNLMKVPEIMSLWEVDWHQSVCLRKEKVDPLVDLLAQGQLTPIGGGKVNNSVADATAVQPSSQNSTHHIVLGTGWLTDTPVSTRQLIKMGSTEGTEAGC